MRVPIVNHKTVIVPHSSNTREGSSKIQLESLMRQRQFQLKAEILTRMTASSLTVCLKKTITSRTLKLIKRSFLKDSQSRKTAYNKLGNSI